MHINEKEVELFGLVSTVIGIAIFIVACSFDEIAGKMTWQHYEGLHWKQVVVIVISGLFSMWGLSLFLKWKKYIWQIRRAVSEHSKVA